MPGRVFVNTPEVEYFWQVDDFLGAFAGAKNQIVILRNPQALVKAANVTQQLGAKANHVHDVRMASQVFRRESRPMRVVQQFFAVCRHHDFVGINHVCIVVDDRLGCPENGLGFQQVVMV